MLYNFFKFLWLRQTFINHILNRQPAVYFTEVSSFSTASHLPHRPFRFRRMIKGKLYSLKKEDKDNFLWNTVIHLPLKIIPQTRITVSLSITNKFSGHGNTSNRILWKRVIILAETWHSNSLFGIAYLISAFFVPQLSRYQSAKLHSGCRHLMDKGGLLNIIFSVKSVSPFLYTCIEHSY